MSDGKCLWVHHGGASRGIEQRFELRHSWTGEAVALEVAVEGVRCIEALDIFMMWEVTAINKQLSVNDGDAVLVSRSCKSRGRKKLSEYKL
jgi:hypothetical protein